MRLYYALLPLLLLSACAPPQPFVAQNAAGKAPTEVSKLIAASEANLFPCSFTQIAGDGAPQIGGRRNEVTIAPGRYVISLECASSYHSFKPQADLVARPGKIYRITGYLVDNSVTIFTMRMRLKIEELSP